MTPTNLPDLYARVVAKRPELAVKNLRTSTIEWEDDSLPITVWIYGWTPKTSDAILDQYAHGMIFARWAEAMPEGTALCCNKKAAWYVFTASKYALAARPTPLEALAAFWMECEA
jgi:hypothetical protein